MMADTDPVQNTDLVLRPGVSNVHSVPRAATRHPSSNPATSPLGFVEKLAAGALAARNLISFGLAIFSLGQRSGQAIAPAKDDHASGSAAEQTGCDHVPLGLVGDQQDSRPVEESNSSGIYQNGFRDNPETAGTAASDAASFDERSGPKSPTTPTANRRDAIRVDRTLYDVLNVSPDATESAIRRAYYVAARDVHPDRNIEDESATRRFQELADAYEILSNPESRAQYDGGSEEVGERVPGSADPLTLFTAVFRDTAFEAFVGDLKVVSIASLLDADGRAPDEDILQRVQEDRVQALGDGLKAMLRRWVEGDKDAFVRWASWEVALLAEIKNGEKLLSAIGNAYVYCADRAARRDALKSPGGLYKDARDRIQGMTAKARAKAAKRSLAKRQQGLHADWARRERAGETMTAQMAEEFSVRASHNCLDAMWRDSVIDISEVIRDVVLTVLSGGDISPAEADAYAAHRSGSDGSEGGSLCCWSRRRGRRQAPQDGRSQIIAARAAGIKKLGELMLDAAQEKRERRPSRK